VSQIKPYHISLFFISAALLSLEISLMRVLKIEGFGNFTYTAIALALTGFGASGTAVCIFEKKIKEKALTISLLSAAGFVFTLGAGVYFSSKIVFDPLRIVWEPLQIFRLLIRYVLYTIPFICGSGFVLISFMLERPGRAYFYNLLGSGSGVIIILLLLYIMPPNKILIAPIGLSLISIILLLFDKRFDYRIVIIALGALSIGFFLYLASDINVLPYKGIALALNLPDASVIERRYSPFGTVEVVESSKLRVAPGISLAFDGELPQQNGLFLDGDELSAIDRIENANSLDYTLFQPQSSVYKLYSNPSVCIIGLGGGTAVERAFKNGASMILCAEENPSLSVLLKERFIHQNNGFFTQPFIKIVNSNARQLMRTYRGDGFDIIDISEADSAVSSIGGIYSTETNYTFTTEAFVEFLDHLKESGTLSVTVVLKYPPRKLLKTVALAKSALETLDEDPKSNLLVLRGWASATVMARRTGFTETEIQKIQIFCNSMFFDFVYYPGMRSTEANRFNIADDAIYYRTVTSMLNDYRRFTRNYLFNVTNPTDERPYFGYFFRLKKVPLLVKEMGKKWLPVVEGGYIVLFSTFITVIILSTLFIIIPLPITNRRMGGGKGEILLYFSLIAIAYIFIEITLMEKFNRYLANPIYSNSVVLAALLIFSGVGSLLTEPLVKRFSSRRFRVLSLAAGFLVFYFSVLLVFGEKLYGQLWTLPLSMRLLITLLIIAPLGIGMGMPFPLGISALKDREDASLPWAWSINGYLSVISSVGVILVASNIGIRTTGFLALLCYLLTLFCFPGRER
jgi:predicted membrane-bound spermidine synthase